MIFRNKIQLLIVIIILLISCQTNQDSDQKQVDEKKLEEPLLKANKQAVIKENEQIDNFIRRHQWKMQESGSGLRYAIYKKGNGQKAEEGQIAVIAFSVELISGEEIYSSKSEGQKEFLIGKGGVESGLEEGILLLHVGDRAKFIIPSHLGFGLLGDQNKVPPKSTLIYDIELLELK
jgi:FKBP-type peptidyl-prolyl cis-trans isomerase FkpA